MVEKELFRVVASDLLYIINEWSDEISDDALRRDCVVLHKLLIEGNLGKVWRFVGFTKEPRILAPVLKVLGDKEQADFIQTGGAHYGGIEVRDFELHHDNSMPPEYAKLGPGIHISKGTANSSTKKAMYLSQFLGDICIIIKGVSISRCDLIIYVLNTLGGKHFDWEREFKEQSKRSAKFIALDTILNNMETAQKKISIL